MGGSYLEISELKALGFNSLGKNVLIARKASIYNPSKISIGDYARIDDFCILSAGQGGIHIGRYVHIACYCSLIGASSIIMHDFSGLSSRVTIYSSTDDFSGEAMPHPTIPEKFRRVFSKPVVLNKHVLIGTGSTILPGVELGEGAAVGAMSLVNKSCDVFGVYAGIPAKKLKERKRNLLQLEKELLNEEKNRSV
jgi:acetyltransferase-like isoleucine patch superfamily enzyme